MYLFTADDQEIQPHLSVLVSPPKIPAGKVAKWETGYNPVTNSQFGSENTGEWILVDDNRGKNLYKTSDGSEYNGDYDGIGPIPEDATLEPRPSELHKFFAGKWVISDEDEATLKKEKKIAEIEAFIETETNIANEKIAPLEDAVDLEIATEEEARQYKEWRKYRVLLNRITSQAGYPMKVKLPIRPVL